MATLAQEIQALLQSLPEIIPEARRLPAIAPQSVQSGNPTPQNVGQTLGPQPGDPRNATRQQFGQDFADAAVGFGTSFADPLGIPSAMVGTVFPGARDAWRRAQQVGGPEASIGGQLVSGYGAANAMLRGGAALATRVGIPQWLGMAGGGAATGAGPAIDYAAGAPGATGMNAMIAPAVGSMFPAGQVAGQFVRNNPGAAGGLAALGVMAAGSSGEADAADPQKKGGRRPITNAQPAQPQQPQAAAEPPTPDAPLDPQTQYLLNNNPGLRARYDALQQARRDLETARRTSVVESRGPTGNRGAREAAATAQAAFDAAQGAYTTALSDASTQARGANPSFRDQFGPVLGNPLALQFGLPLAFGAFTRGGGAALARNRNARIGGAVDEGNAALAAGNIPLAAQNSSNANAMLAGAQGGNRRLGDVSFGDMLAGGAVGEMAAFAPLVWDRGLPVGRPEQASAAAALSDPMQVATTAARGLLGGVGAYKMGNAMAGAANNYLGGRNLLPPQAEAGSLATRIQQAQAQPPPPPPPPPYRGQFRADFQNTVATAVENVSRRRPFDPAALLGTVEVAASRQPMLQRALEQVRADVVAANGNREQLTQIAQRIRSGGYQNLAIMGGTAAAAHHSLSQPRGDDGRFVLPQE